MRNTIFFLWCFLFTTIACEQQATIYEIERVTLRQNDFNKPNIKTSIAFISIAHSDLFGYPIPQNKLDRLNNAYLGAGDKGMIQDLIIKNFLNDSTIVVPLRDSILAHPETFIKNAYERFYNRPPSTFEVAFLKNYIETNATIDSKLIFYSLMKAEEYQYF